MHSSSSLFSASSLVQYAFFAVMLYFLAGAPLSSVVSESYSGSAASVGVTQEKIDSLVVPERDLVCGEHQYKGVHILHREPLVLYIEGFLSDEEARHVVQIRYAGLVGRMGKK